MNLSHGNSSVFLYIGWFCSICSVMCMNSPSKFFLSCIYYLIFAWWHDIYVNENKSHLPFLDNFCFWAWWISLILIYIFSLYFTWKIILTHRFYFLSWSWIWPVVWWWTRAYHWYMLWGKKSLISVCLSLNIHFPNIIFLHSCLGKNIWF
jgi:hypothetical protein